MQSNPNSVPQIATGPRTVAGKKRSRRNALKHAIFSHFLILDGERRTYFEKLHRTLREYFQPEGAAEEILVEQLSIQTFRWGRVLIVENAITARSPIFGGVVTQQKSVLLEAVMKKLRQLSENVIKPGFDFTEDIAALNSLYAEFGAYSDADFCASFSVFMKQGVKHTTRSGAVITKEQMMKLAIDLVKLELLRLQDLLKKAESNETVSTSLSSFLPLERELDLVIRYENHINREFDKKLNQLERLQRARRGYPPPPTIKVDLG